MAIQRMTSRRDGWPVVVRSHKHGGVYGETSGRWYCSRCHRALRYADDADGQGEQRI